MTTEAKTCCFSDCPRRVPPTDYDFCADCSERFWRHMKKARREKMPWNYRVVRYEANGEMLVGLMEVFYSEAGEPNGFARASVLHWTSIDELRGTLDLMQKALAAPELAVDGDVAQHLIDGEREAEDLDNDDDEPAAASE